MKQNILDILLDLCLGIGIQFIVVLITSALSYWLWGIIVVPVFNAPSLTFWQTYGLIWLIRLSIYPITIKRGK